MPVVGRKSSSFLIIGTLTGIVLALIGDSGRAQNLDEGKSGAQLFAATCANCHHSPRGLAKDRFSWTLSFYLQKHYTSSAASAQALGAYLQSADAGGPKAQPAAGKSRAPPTSVSEAPLRPPAEIPAH
jgi:hypothetical protein